MREERNSYERSSYKRSVYKRRSVKVCLGVIQSHLVLLEKKATVKNEHNCKKNWIP